MPDSPSVTIVLRKEVVDKAEAQALVNAVKTKLEDKPSVTITAKFNEGIEPTNS